MTTAARRASGTGPPRNAVSAAVAHDGVLLQADDVTVRLAGRDVLHDVGFTVRRGEFTGLIGSNGAGKTTLLRAILGLQHLTSGRISVAGQAGYVPQKVVLDPDMPVRARDLVSLGIDGNRLGIPLPSRGRRQRVDQTLAAVGATSYADQRVGNLSGGELQRVLIAHALISEPALLLLDEPLAALDIRSEREIVDLLAAICRGRNVAVLMSAHDMNPLLPVMDRLVYLAGGRAASGSTNEVVRPEVLSKLYGQHVDVIRVHGRILVVAGRAAEPLPPWTAEPCDDAPCGDVPPGELLPGEVMQPAAPPPGRAGR